MNQNAGLEKQEITEISSGHQSNFLLSFHREIISQKLHLHNNKGIVCFGM